MFTGVRGLKPTATVVVSLRETEGKCPNSSREPSRLAAHGQAQKHRLFAIRLSGQRCCGLDWDRPRSRGHFEMRPSRTKFSRLWAEKKTVRLRPSRLRQMKSNLLFRGAHDSRHRAFSRTDLAALIGVVALLSLLVFPVLAREADSAERAVCLNNMQRIMAAVAMYSTDNNDSLPHPSWGSDLTGPDNWCYATRLPTGQSASSAAGKGGPDAHAKQIPFYLAGQLARFLESQRVLVCPTDWRDSMGSKSFLYVARAEKLTSYAMSGTVGGYVGPKAPANALGLKGKTFKISDFLPTDMLLFELNESEPFYFTDAG